MNLTRQAATFGLVANATTTGTNVTGTHPIGTVPSQATFPAATVAFAFKATSAYAGAVATWDLRTGIVTATGYVTILDGDGKDFEGIAMPVLDSIYGVLVEFTQVNGTLTIGSTDANFPSVVLAGSGSLLLVANDGETPAGTMALTFSAAGDSATVTVVALSDYLNTYSVLFDGVDEHLDCGTDSALNPSEITISMWIKPDALTNWDYLVSRGQADYNKAYRFEVGATQLFCAFGNGSSNGSITKTHGMSNGTWYHVAVTYDGATATLYVDGASIGTASISIVMETAADTTAICKPAGSAPYFDGRVDEVAIFDSALSAADISSIWNSGTPTSLIYLAPVAWWRLGDSNAGAGNLIYDEVDKALGADLVTNGDFATDSDWTKGTGWSISGGTAVFNTSDNSTIIQGLSVTEGRVYQIVINGTITSGRLKLSGSSGLGADTEIYLPHTSFYRHDGGSDDIQIRTIGASVGTLTDVSVKEINGNPGILKNGPSFSTDVP